jgi:hypothetical protein
VRNDYFVWVRRKQVTSKSTYLAIVTNRDVVEAPSRARALGQDIYLR